jgi:anti-repressor protein
MNLINIQAKSFNGTSVQTCSARDLHAYLGIIKPFTAWLDAQFVRARLQDGRDYLFYQEVINPEGGRPRHECAITLDAAKQIAMMSGGDKAFEVRDYFLACERKALEKFDPMAYLNDPANVRSLLLTYTEKVIALESKVVETEAKVAQQAAIVQEQAPMVEALNRIAISDGSFSLREAAKVLQMREKDFLQYLHNKSWIYRTQHGNRWMAHATTLRQGFMEHKTTTGEKDDGTQWTSSQAKITANGIAKLATMLGVDVSQNDSEFKLVA